MGHARCGLTKRRAKALKLHSCYLMVSCTREGDVLSVQTYSERHPTMMIGELMLLILTTHGQTYQKALLAMEHIVRSTKSLEWAGAWIFTDRETHGRKLALWKDARHKMITVDVYGLRAKFIQAFQNLSQGSDHDKSNL